MDYILQSTFKELEGGDVFPKIPTILPFNI